MTTPAKLAALLTTVLSALAIVAAPTNAAPGKGTLFGTDANLGRLLTIDPATGASTLVGDMGNIAVPSLAVDPTTGIMYAGRGAGFAFIYTVDPATAALTFVGDTGLGLGTTAVGGLDFRADGTLFAAVNIVGAGGTGSDHLATIDKTTGAATVIGPFGVEGMEGIAFDSSGTLWGSRRVFAQQGTPGLYRINPATGTATSVGPTVDASGTPLAVGVVSLQFACDGTLYGGTGHSGVISEPDGGRLVTIDPATGVFTRVGSARAAIRSLGALAFQDPRCLPSSKEECKNGGWRNFEAFRNQGDCVSFVATRGTNPPSGS